MSKGNMLLGYARGKVGDLVFTRRNGEQVTRPRVRVVNNPKTTAQQIQRMIFASVSWAYQLLKSICDHSFEGVRYGANSQARFFSLNLKALRAYYPTDQDPDKRPVDGMAFILPSREGAIGCGLQISEGTIPEVKPYIDSESGQLNAFGKPVSVEAGAQMTYAQMLESLNAVAGDQITLVAVDDMNQLHLSRYVINADATPEQLAQPWDVTGKNAVFDATKTSIDKLLLLTYIAIEGETYADIDSRTEFASCSIIISRKEGDKWLRSNAYLWNTQDEAPQYSAAYALPYWEMAGTDIETMNKKYLNNADI